MRNIDTDDDRCISIQARDVSFQKNSWHDWHSQSLVVGGVEVTLFLFREGVGYF